MKLLQEIKQMQKEIKTDYRRNEKGRFIFVHIFENDASGEKMKRYNELVDKYEEWLSKRRKKNENGGINV